MVWINVRFSGERGCEIFGKVGLKKGRMQKHIINSISQGLFFFESDIYYFTLKKITYGMYRTQKCRAWSKQKKVLPLLWGSDL